MLRDAKPPSAPVTCEKSASRRAPSQCFVGNAAAPAIDLSAAAMPMTGGKIYFNEARGWFRA